MSPCGLTKYEAYRPLNSYEIIVKRLSNCEWPLCFSFAINDIPFLIFRKNRAIMNSKHIFSMRGHFSLVSALCWIFTCHLVISIDRKIHAFITHIKKQEFSKVTPALC